MTQKHFVTKLKANSPYIGQTCPVGRTSLQSGDEVVICQQQDTPITLAGWQSVESDWNSRCHYCGGAMILSKSEYPPYPPPHRFPNNGVGKIVAAVLIVVLLLGGGIIAGLYISDAISQPETPITLTPQRDEDASSANNSDSNNSGEVLPEETDTPTPILLPTPTSPTDSKGTTVSVVTPTHTPSPTPISTHTPSPMPTSAFLFEDDFSNNKNGWQPNTKEDVFQTIRDGQLALNLDTQGGETVAWSSLDESFENFILEVETTYESGSDSHEYGVLVRKEDDNNFYQFALVNNMFNAFKYEDGEWIALQSNTPSAAIGEPGRMNSLKVITVDDRFQFFANGELLTDLTDDSFSIGDIALFAAHYNPGEAKITFDNVRISPATQGDFSVEKPKVSAPIQRTYQLAFTKYENGSHNLYIADTNGDNQQLIFTRAAGPSFSPDKKRLFFFGEAGVNQQFREEQVACEFGTISDGIVAVDLSSPPRDICQVQYDAWFCERKGVDLQGEPSDVCTANGISVYQNLDWKEGTARWASASPDNYAVAFDAKPGSERRIYFRSMLGTNQSFRFELIGEQGSWSPDGQRMVYRSGRDNQQGLWISNRDDTGHTNLTIGGTDSFPAWSPNGQTIAFSREVDGNWDIYTMNIDGTNLRRLTDASGQDILPVYTPNGDIIFRSARTDSWGIWKMNGNGANQQMIIPDAPVGPDWVYSRIDVK